MKGIMRFNGVERTLLDFRFSHDRDIDILGIPCTYPKDSFIRVSFAAEEGDGFFLDWMCGRSAANEGYTGYWYDGEIVFYDELSDGQEFYRYDLRGVMPVYFLAGYNQQDGMFVSLTLTANERIYNRFMGAELFYLYKTWYVEPEEKPKLPTDTTPKVIDYYLTDKNGNSFRENLDSYIGEKIFLNVRTQNLIGQTLTISLNNSDVDFEYENKRLEKDMLTDYKIKEDFEQIELKVIKQTD